MEKIYLSNSLTREERTNILNSRMRGIKPAICVERARLVTESYTQTEGQPTILRRAKALAYILQNMTVFIDDYEIIVGNHASKARWAPMFPDICTFSEKELDLCPIRKVDTLQISQQDKRYLLDEIYPYWVNKNLESVSEYYFSDEIMKVLKAKNKVFNPTSRLRSGYGHYVPDIPKVLQHGFIGIEKEAKDGIRSLDILDPDYSDKHLFYQAVLIICEGVRRFAERYSELAKKLAQEETDADRKRELELISRVCSVVPYEPARNLHEALQAYWFTLLIDYIFQNGSAVSAGRFDQYMYPFYKEDINNGLIQDEDALEMIEALFVKHIDVIKAGTDSSVRYTGGFATTIHLSLGGLNEDGSDSANELTYLVVEADRNVFNSEPNVGVRINKNTPERLLDEVLKTLVVNYGGKYPIFNDEAIVPALIQDGVSVDDAKNYCIVGCVEPTPSGNCMGLTNACYFNVAKCLELALNNGKCLLTDEQIGIRTGDISEFKNFDDVLAAFNIQLDYFVNLMISAMNTIMKVIAVHTPHIYCSLLLDNCLERGLDSVCGGAKYDYVGVQGVGCIDAADSLAAIKTLVFQDKAITMEVLLAALKENFAGAEVLRQQLLTQAPKYGNNIDEADAMAKYVTEKYCLAVRKGRDFRGAQYRAGLYCLSSNTPIGKQTGALPSGRLAGTPLGDGGVSPKHGMDTNGPTAAMISVASIDHFLATNGTNYNQKYLPSLFDSEKNRSLLIKMIRTFFEMGGFQIQFNMLSPETLQEAQRNPESHRNLVVRVAGYSAFFVELDKEIQDEIISRTKLDIRG